MKDKTKEKLGQAIAELLQLKKHYAYANDEETERYDTV